MSVSRAVESLNNQFGIRFNLVGILPSILLIVFSIILVFNWSDKPSQLPNIDLFIKKMDTMNLTESILLLVLVIFLSILTYPLQLRLVRFFEGYWANIFPVNKFASIGVTIHEHKRDKLEKLDFDDLYDYYPKEDLLPTSLGNVLRASESIAGQRYGLDTVNIWPRLYPLIPDSLKNILIDQRNQFDLAIRFCAVFIIMAIISSLYYVGIIYSASISEFPYTPILNLSKGNVYKDLSFIIILGIKYGCWLLIPIFTIILSWISYKNSISIAISYGVSIKTAFDLYRFDLLKALHLPLPKNLSKEKEDNGILSDFLAYVDPKRNYEFSYEHDAENKIENRTETNAKSDSNQSNK